MTARVDHRPLLADKVIQTWYDETALRSKLTAEVDPRQLGLLSHEVKLRPRVLAEVASSEPGRLPGIVVRDAT